MALPVLGLITVQGTIGQPHGQLCSGNKENGFRWILVPRRSTAWPLTVRVTLIKALRTYFYKKGGMNEDVCY